MLTPEMIETQLEALKVIADAQAGLIGDLEERVEHLQTEVTILKLRERDTIDDTYAPEEMDGMATKEIADEDS